MIIELIKLYSFNCPCSFGTLSQNKVNKLFQDGGKASGFLELQLEEWFPDLTFVDGKGYDHIDKNNVKYDAKCFTKSGCKFCPSVMLGAGRKIDEEKLWNHAMEMVYIFCCIVDFPTVHIVFKKGSDLIRYRKGHIPFGDRHVIFG